MAQVIIFLPGTLGSEIVLAGQRVWPGSLTQLLTGFSAEQFGNLLRPEAVAGDIIRNFAIVPQYGALMNFLESCGFSETGTPPTLYACAYDWRKSNREAAKTLAAKVQQVQKDHDGDAKITLIAHSMGGLVSRYYLESGAFDKTNSPGFDLITNLYTLATPHLGAPIAVIKALGKDKTIFLSALQIQELASNPLYPSLYELFPHRSLPIVWDLGSQPVFQPVDLYGPKGQAAGLSAQNLQVADDFHKSLKGRGAQSQVRYFFFSGTQKRTAINLTAMTNARGAVAIDGAERDDAGDGTVPIWSSRIDIYPTEYVGGEHSEVYKDFQLKQTLKRLLVPQGMVTFALTAPHVVVTITKLVLRPGESSQLDITLAAHTTKLSGSLIFEKATFEPDESLTGYTPVGAAQAIIYEGPSFDRLRIQFTAPLERGVYRVSFVVNDHAANLAPSESDQFFVQESPGP